jgi:fatty-acyl-CoA synthase
MGSVVAEVFRRYPGREAFVAGDRRLTYADSAAIVGRLMSAFAARGIGLGSAVALLSPNRPECWLVAVAA